MIAAQDGSPDGWAACEDSMQLFGSE